jgi:hypothetical protein
MANILTSRSVRGSEDPLAILHGVSNPSGVARALVKAIDAAYLDRVNVAEDPSVRSIVHQLAYF